VHWGRAEFFSENTKRKNGAPRNITRLRPRPAGRC
jgi:hypothetical protein